MHLRLGNDFLEVVIKAKVHHVEEAITTQCWRQGFIQTLTPETAHLIYLPGNGERPFLLHGNRMALRLQKLQHEFIIMTDKQDNTTYLAKILSFSLQSNFHHFEWVHDNCFC